MSAATDRDLTPIAQLDGRIEQARATVEMLEGVGEVTPHLRMSTTDISLKPPPLRSPPATGKVSF